MSELQRDVVLPQICSLVTDGTHDSPELKAFGVPFIKGEHINTGRIDFENCDYISNEDHAQCIKRVKPETNDILLANIGASIGDCARVNSDVEFSIKNLALLRPNPDKVDPSYFYNLVRSHHFQGRLLNQRLGAAQPYVSLQSLRSLKVDVIMSLDSQAKIGEIADAYDNLIENNRRRIQLLEQAARLLYMEWFVHLRFPGHEHFSFTDGLPEGWKKVPLSELCSDFRESANPKDLPPDTPYIGLGHIPRRSITLDKWGSATEVVSNKFKFAEGDILFGKIRPYFHKVGFALVDGIASADTVVIRPTKIHLYYYVLFLLSSDEFVALASKTVREGAKMPRADWKYLLKSEFKLPSNTLLGLFSDGVKPICRQLRTLALQNHQLAQGRDLLLQRLVNGEMAI